MSEPIKELLIDQAEGLVLRNRLNMEKQAIQAQLADLNARCAVRLPTREFQRIQSERGQVVKALMEKEREIAELKTQRAAVDARIGIEKLKGMSPARIRDLVDLRDKWHGFSMDADNHQKAREAAWKFSQELRTILKLHFEGTI